MSEADDIISGDDFSIGLIDDSWERESAARHTLQKIAYGYSDEHRRKLVNAFEEAVAKRDAGKLLETTAAIEETVARDSYSKERPDYKRFEKVEQGELEYIRSFAWRYNVNPDGDEHFLDYSEMKEKFLKVAEKVLAVPADKRGDFETVYNTVKDALPPKPPRS